MAEIHSAKFIGPNIDMGTRASVFFKKFRAENVKKASLQITAKGVYVACLNGKRVGDFFLAPGWSEYFSRILYQTYDITDMLGRDNELIVTVGWGWFFHRVYGQTHSDLGLCAALVLEKEDGSVQTILTDESWDFGDGPVVYDDFYKGETYDSRRETRVLGKAVEIPRFSKELVPTDGEKLCEHERFPAQKLIITPAGETVIDFGQNLAGHVEFKTAGKYGDELVVRHAEVLDANGNFYLDNLRAADNRICFICDGKPHIYKSQFTYQGFRYIRLEGFGDDISLSDFTAIAVYSDIRRIGYFRCSDDRLNKLFENTIWGQKSNYVDIPTDCPQRDERQGWTGDAYMDLVSALYSFDVEKFYKKWLEDMRLSQADDGRIPNVVPLMDLWSEPRSIHSSAIMSAVGIPWKLYLTYGNRQIIAGHFDAEKRLVDWMLSTQIKDGLWATSGELGDWLALDGEEGSYHGSTEGRLLYTAYAAQAVSLFIKQGAALGKDMSEYRKHFDKIRSSFIKRFVGEDGRMIQETQSACVYALAFNLCDDKATIAKQHRELIKKWGHLTTGMGSPNDLFALSDNGNEDVAYDILLRTEYPSWLYAVERGATTLWEHWDGLKPDGTMWNPDMNSFNHHACCVVADWLYGAIAGIRTDENAPGFKHFFIKPIVDSRLDYASASIETRYGTVKSGWKREVGSIVYEFTVPEGTTATLCVGNNKADYGPGSYSFTSGEALR